MYYVMNLLDFKIQIWSGFSGKESIDCMFIQPMMMVMVMILFVPFARREQKSNSKSKRRGEGAFDTYWMDITSGSWASLFSVALESFAFIGHLYHFSIWKFVFKQKKRSITSKRHINECDSNNNRKKKQNTREQFQRRNNIYIRCFISHLWMWNGKGIPLNFHC